MKWMGWLGKLVIGVVLVSFLSVFTTVYLVDQYVQAVLERWNLSGIERPSLDLGELFSLSDDVEQRTEQEGLASRKDALGLNQVSESATVTGEDTPSEKVEADPPAGAVKANAKIETEALEHETEVLPVFGRSELSQSLVMSAEEFNEKRKNLSDEDKLEIFTIMVKKLPQEELQNMSTLLEDGITEEEVKAMEEVINAYLHQDDVARLLSILNKY